MPVVQIDPLSLNNCFRGRRFMTPEYKAWREEVMLKLAAHPKFTEKRPYRLSICFYRKRMFTYDLSNLIKTFEDALVKAAIIPDDAYITELSVSKHKGEGSIEYQVEPC